MQLNMVTPMDLGLERQDGIDDSDMFDLGEVEGTTSRSRLGPRKGVQGAFADDEIMESGDEGSDELEGIDEEEEEEDDGLDDEERKVQRLEVSLDALYDQYHQHKSDRDARHRAKEERRKRDAAEGGEWLGIKAQESESEEEDQDPAPAPDSDDFDTDDELEAALLAKSMIVTKAEKDEGEMEDDDEEDVDPELRLPAKQSRRVLAAIAKKLNGSNGGALITKLPVPGIEDKKAGEKSRAAKMWFDQPMFKGLAGLEEMMSGDAPQEDDDGEDDQEVGSDDEDLSANASSIWQEMNPEDDAAEAAALQVSHSRNRLHTHALLTFGAFATGLRGSRR
jgi:AdoMet-dependent rRNA methyltransferase SPB1